MHVYASRVDEKAPLSFRSSQDKNQLRLPGTCWPLDLIGKRNENRNHVPAEFTKSDKSRRGHRQGDESIHLNHLAHGIETDIVHPA
jgi:hypothetical protein